MRTRTVWTIVACIILVPALLLGTGAEWLFGFSQLLYNPIRYRVATSLELVDHGTVRRSTVNSDCWAFVSTRGMIRGVQKSRRGEDNHVVLGDGSILLLPDLDPCRWIETKPAPGTSYAIAPAARGSPPPAGTIELRPGEAWRFDSAIDPASVTIYQLTELFGQEHDELQIKSATLSAVEAARENEFVYALEQRFPWFRDVPRGD